MKVLCFGSLNIDYVYSVDHFVTKGETLSSSGMQVFPGGKGLNQSVALGKAGVEVYQAGAIGSDGAFLLQVLHEAYVNTEYVSVIDSAHTGNAIIQKDTSGDNCILLCAGTNNMINSEQVDAVISHFSSGDYLILQNEINNLPYIMKKAHEKGMFIVLNPSPMNSDILQLPLQYVDLFMLNEVEARQLLHDDSACSSQLSAQLIERFPDSSVVLTLGANGSVYLDKKTRVSQSAFKITVADTTAAGDTFTGYFISCLMNGKGIQQSLETASAAAAIACSRPGAAPSIPTPDEVSSFLLNKSLLSHQ